MTQQNAALVEQSAAAAESLKDQAARLAEVVQQFKLGAAWQPRPMHKPAPAWGRTGGTAALRSSTAPALLGE